MIKFRTSSYSLGGCECMLNVKGAADILGCGGSETDLVITMCYLASTITTEIMKLQFSAVEVSSQGESNGVQMRCFIFRRP
jgi:hypothetical protein